LKRGERRWERRTLQRIFGFAQAQIAGLLQRGEGLVYARDGELVGEDVEVADCVVDELGLLVVSQTCGGRCAYRRWILVEKHDGDMMSFADGEV